MLKWKSMLSLEEIPNNKQVLARVSDNVLESYHWIPFLITISDGVVTKVSGMDFYHLRMLGFYHQCMIGWDIDMLANWTCHDDTGNHPETYHELFV